MPSLCLLFHGIFLGPHNARADDMHPPRVSAAWYPPLSRTDTLPVVNKARVLVQALGRLSLLQEASLCTIFKEPSHEAPAFHCSGQLARLKNAARFLTTVQLATLSSQTGVPSTPTLVPTSHHRMSWALLMTRLHGMENLGHREC